MVPVEAEVLSPGADNDQPGRSLLARNPVLTCPDTPGIGAQVPESLVERLQRSVVQPFVGLSKLPCGQEPHARDRIKRNGPCPSGTLGLLPNCPRRRIIACARRSNR